MKKLKVSDVIVVGMFVFGLAFALTQRITHQDLQVNNIVEVTQPQDPLTDPAS